VLDSPEAAAGLRRPAGCLSLHPVTRSARTQPLLELINGVKVSHTVAVIGAA
jgi:hypothetical protein